MKYFGLLICLGIIGGAVVQVGPPYNDFMSATFVFGGALGFALLKNEPLQIAKNCGTGAVFRLAGNAGRTDRHFRQRLWCLGQCFGDGAGAGRVHAAALYGYTVNLVCMAIAANPKEAE